MDLVAGVRKEGSRGGRDVFKWEDVKDSQHRENYLGHSLMAPVGRWQRNKDLSWYAKGDDSREATEAAAAHAEEIRRIKEAEQDALSQALGYPVEPRLQSSLAAQPREVEKAIREAAGGDEERGEGGKGVGFGGFNGKNNISGDTQETMMGYAGDPGGLTGGNIKRARKERRDDRRGTGKETDGIGTITITATTTIMTRGAIGEKGQGQTQENGTGLTFLAQGAQTAADLVIGTIGSFVGGAFLHYRDHANRAFPHLYDDSDDSDDDDDLLPSDFEEKVICPPILLVSRQTYTEAISLFYGGNTFRFNLCLSVDNDAFSLKRRHLCRMQGVDLEIDRLTGAEGEELCDLAAGLIKEANARPHRKGALAVEFKNFITIQDYEGELLETIKAVTQVEQVFLVLSDYRSKLAQAFYERTGPLWELKAILEEAFDVVTKESRTGEWPHRLVFAFTFGSEQKARSQF
ncbi:MAG: hypothetical protein LQ351_002457 [Letrouitia transgressa]|nr:MAG: hypothetical protein LQ351_002457 [Letrouitia transgressa]